MARNAYRDRMFPPAEVRRILRRAAELEETSRQAGAAGQGRGHTLEEIERIAGDAGISETALHRAIDGEEEATEPAPIHPRSFAGAPARISIERTVRGSVNAANHAQLAKAMRNAVGELGSAQAVGDALNWSLSTPTGRTVYAVVEPEGDGRVTVRVDEDLRRLRGSIFGGIGGGVGGGGLGLVAPALAALSTALLPLGVFAWVLAVFLVARVLYVRRFRAREKQLQALVTSVGAVVEGAGPRVATDRGARVESRGARVEAGQDEVLAEEEDAAGRAGMTSRTQSGRAGEG